MDFFGRNSFIFKLGKAPALAALVFGLALTTGPDIARASTISILDVSGTTNTGQDILPDTTAGVSFDLTKIFSNVSISADILCVGCTGAFYLMKDLIGPTSTLVNFITGKNFSNGVSTAPVLSNLTLGAGKYFLLLAITDGGAGWRGSNPADVTVAEGVSLGGVYFAEDTAALAPRSEFSLVTSKKLHFSITADDGVTEPPSNVPLPASAFGYVFALAGSYLAARRARTKARIG